MIKGRMKLWIQAMKMSLLHREDGLTLRDKVRTDVSEKKPRHLIRIPPGTEMMYLVCLGMC